MPRQKTGNNYYTVSNWPNFKCRHINWVS